MSASFRRYLGRWRWVLFLSVACFLPRGLWGQQIVGPGGGGAMFHVTINPHNADEVLLSCDMTGAYISHDGGHHWRMFNLRGSVRFFAFDPVVPHTIYAGTDALWRSKDDGTTWHLVWPSPSAVRAIEMDSDHADETMVASPNSIGQIVVLAIDPEDSRILYAAATKDGRAAIVVSRDSGLTWKMLHPLVEVPLHLWIDVASPKGGRNLYTAMPHGIEARIDGAWRHKAAPAGVEFNDVSAGFREGQSGPAFYAVGSQGKGPSDLWISMDGGENWTRSQLPGAAAQVRAVAASLHHPEVVYASYKGMQLEGEAVQGVARSDDFGQHWRLVWRSTHSREAENVHDAWIAGEMTPEWTEEPLSLTVDGRNPDLAYATDLGRTMGTTDGGKNWTARYSEKAGGSSWVSTGLDVTTSYGYLVDPFDSKRRFIPMTDIGLFRSEDAGRSWVRSVEGIPPSWRNTTYAVAFDPQIRGKMWAAMSGTHDLPRPKMWRHTLTSAYVGGICVSTDGGRTWRVSNQGMPPAAATHVLLDPTSTAGHRTLWAATMGHGIYRSNDDGKTWEAVNNGIVQENALAWRLARATDGTLYALIARRSEDGSIGNAGDGALYRSTDRGDHWSRVALPQGANAPNGIAIDPENPKRLYLALWARATPDGLRKAEYSKQRQGKMPRILNGRGGGIAVSSDGGQTWRWVLERDRHIYDVTIDPRDPKILYATGFESSAWISHDRGEHWSRIPGFRFKWGHRVQADPENPGMVFISTFGGGVWHVPVAGEGKQDIATPEIVP
ncbi:WD40/YVTN/BNR-like repeat-containing protein [Edaphobacter albus]|uniref:WD40/YVTN/BNR-like repeat-containing protein n=1 Tax=Edaphobacter sp. 4G125 TaxID=2763071 RepID=UPI001648E3C4|nr:sialidase family protein [Edaphobacter sp. 4G125]QNI36136.1 hypothetical protein H7846_14205 [Edaphobacter sp. 4G125]